MKLIIAILLFMLPQIVTAQLPKHAQKLVGVWKYEGGSGFEIWKSNEGALTGEGFRSTKLGDSVKVEMLAIYFQNKKFVYSLETDQIMAENSVVIKKSFTSKNNKMIFYNEKDELPASIRYKFAFLNKDKLKITLKYNSELKSTTLKLDRQLGLN